ncbi:MAG: hypothetical protein KKF41_04380 [Actinobacteria bacterium]|nr:hypothetical protein [Actinomycetota bacterium]MBU1943447.1 hypothetical protein [Actinomycetota bacterium]MBU2686804.1 hypothetical protein [Actinomycetota bacterium]
MRRLVGLLLLVVLVGGVLAVAGCGGGGEEAIVTPEGELRYDAEKNQIIVTGETEEVIWTADTGSEKALGVPVPDNADLVEGTAIVVAGSKGDEEWAGASFTSPDGVQKVIDWYKSEFKDLPGLSDTSTVLDGQAVGLFSFKADGVIKSITVNASEAGDKGETEINIASAAGIE